MKRWSPNSAYTALLRKFGTQGWWPVVPKGGDRPAYHPGRYGVPDERGALEISFGAIMTQNTAWTNVERAVSALHEAGAISPSLLALPTRRLERLIRPSGYFRQKAARLRRFLEFARGRAPTLSSLLREPLGLLREGLLSVNGIGPETADSILLYAGGRPAFVVDAYTLRIGRRLGWFAEIDYHGAQRFLTERLSPSVIVYQEFHALIVALAKFYCRTEPLCGACPLRKGCAHALG